MNISTNTSEQTMPTPRLPAWARVLLSLAALWVASISPVIPRRIPGVRAALEGEDLVVATLVNALVLGTALAIFLLASGALIRGVDRRRFAALGLRVDARAVLALLAGMVIALLVLLLAAGLAHLFDLGRMPDLTGAPEGEVEPLWFLLLYIFLYAFVLQGIGEEVLFRGYLMTSLARRPMAAVLVSAGAFSIFHLISDGGQQNALEHVLYLAIPLGFSLSAAFLAIKLRSVWAAVGIHGGFHVVNGFGQGAGIVSDGPAMWLLLGALHAVAGLPIAWRIPRERWVEIGERGPYAR